MTKERTPGENVARRSGVLLQFESFDQQFWKIENPPKDQPSTDDFNDIFQAVGQATNAWEGVQESLTGLFICTCGLRGVSHQTGISRAFGTIETLRGKWDAITYAAEVFFALEWDDLGIKDIFNEISRVLTKAAYKRNDVAHGRVQGYVSFHDEEMAGEIPVRKMKNWGIFLCPPAYSSTKNSLSINYTENPNEFQHRGKYYYTSSEILSLVDKFNILSRDLKRFADKIQPFGPIQPVVPDYFPPLIDEINAARANEDKKQRADQEQRLSDYKRRQQEPQQASRQPPQHPPPQPPAPHDERPLEDQSEDQSGQKG